MIQKRKYSGEWNKIGEEIKMEKRRGKERVRGGWKDARKKKEETGQNWISRRKVSIERGSI